MKKIKNIVILKQKSTASTKIQSKILQQQEKENKFLSKSNNVSNKSTTENATTGHSQKIPKGKTKNVKTENNINSSKSKEDPIKSITESVTTEKCIPVEDSNSEISNVRKICENSQNKGEENKQNCTKPEKGQDKSIIKDKEIEKQELEISKCSKNRENENEKKNDKISQKPKNGLDTSTAEKKTESKFTKPPSLMNVGATCYLNSALQGLSSCDKFLEELSELHKKYQYLEKLSLFHKLIDILNGGKCDRLEISRNPIFRNWNKPGQQDSFELLAYVMNQVYNEIRKHLENKEKIHKRDMQEWLKEKLPMRIIIKYTIICSCMKNVEVPLQSDLALHVAIPSQKGSDLQSLVEQFFEEDIIEDYECDKEDCDGKGAKRNTLLLPPLPRTLCIHLQRTFWNGRRMQKIDDRIKFSKSLTINSKFTVGKETDNKISNPEIPDGDQSQKKAIDSLNEKSSETLPEHDSQQISTNIDQPQNEDYDLMSVIVHYGSVYGGHYVCYKKMNDKWFLTNDSSIRKVTEDEVYNCEAYILFYEKS